MVQAMPYPNITDSKQDCLEYVAVLQDRLLENGVLTEKSIIRLRRKKAKLPLTIFYDPLIQEGIKKLGMQEPRVLCPQTFQTLFWQEVYDDLGIKAEVPLMPKLTEEQLTSLDHFRFLPIYFPRFAEKQYPKSFVKPTRGQFLNGVDIERQPLKGQWVAVETIKKPDYDDPRDYPDDRLMEALKRKTRFYTSYAHLASGVLSSIAMTVGFTRKRASLFTAERWSFTANIFNWLRVKRGLSYLPDLGSTRSWEWCKNYAGSERQLIVGHSDHGGLASISRYWDNHTLNSLGFRVLVFL